MLREVLHQITGAAGKLVSGTIGLRLFGGRPGRRSPGRPVIFPAAGDALPLRGRAIHS